MRRIFLPVLFLIFSFNSFSQKITSQPKAMEWKDVSSWKYIPSSTVNLSPDGKWAAYALVSIEGDGEIFLKNLVTDSVKQYPAGGTLNPSMEFSEDGKYFAFKEYPKFKETKAAAKNPGKQLFEKLHLVDLSNLNKIDFDRAGKFSFNGKEVTYLAIPIMADRGPGSKPEDAKGINLLLYELATGKKVSIGSVGEFSFNEKGNILAYTVDAANKAQNGLFTFNPADKRIAVLDNDTIVYKSLTWTKDKDALAVLKMSKDKNFKTDKGSVLGVKDFGNNPTIVFYNPLKDSTNFPKEMTISGNRAPYWSEDLTRIIFGINTLEAVKKESAEEPKDTSKMAAAVKLEKIKTDTSIKSIDDLKKALAKLEEPKTKSPDKKDIDKPDMVIWNWQDRRLQSNQQVTERMDKNFSFVAVFNVLSNKYFALNDSGMLSVRIMPKELYALGFSDSAYLLNRSLDGQNYTDLYIIDMKSGIRSSFRQNFYLPSYSSMPNPSPDGKKFVFGNKGDFYIYDIFSKKEENITAGIPSSFVDTEDDHNVTKPLTDVSGWSPDGKYILINDLWDLWQINVEGKEKAVNLTVDGAVNKIRYQQVFNIYPEDKGIDLKKPQYISMYGEWTKKSGLAKLVPGKNGLKAGVERLLWEDAAFGNFNKAKLSDTYYFSKEDFNKPTEFFVTNSQLKNPKQFTKNTPGWGNYTFSAGTRLVNYVTDKGDSLQGVLYLPAGYEEGKKYPTIVYYYEKTSQGRHRYANPAFSRTGYNPTMFTSNGYAVFTPDIVYKLDDPGMSAVWAVLPAVKAAIATGIVDADRMGLHGHSWGGYQTAFLATQSNLFKAAAPGAALTDMISMYNLIYWNSGGANMSIFEASQGRFRGAPWENWDSYLRNSPLYYVKQVHTPILMLHNDKDGAVDFTQGLEFYNALRRLKKPVVLIQYKGENHGLAKLENMKDYGVRMLEFFDHFLKGKPAPDWWENGIDRLKMEEHLEKRAF